MKLDRLTLIREVYRNLINNGRSYAAFQEKIILPFVEKLSLESNEILDPMSGYGSLMLFSSKFGINYYGLEYNFPLYLWQILNNPKNVDMFLAIIDRLKLLKLPKISVLAEESNDWFTLSSKEIIKNIFEKIRLLFLQIGIEDKKSQEYSLALLLPFSGRLSASVPGNVPLNVKRGGLCIYKNYEIDFIYYLDALRNRLEQLKKFAKSFNHSILLGDCRTFKFPKKYFSAMITSPPYPNHGDFTSLFAVEYALLGWLLDENTMNLLNNEDLAIGTNKVSGRETVEIKSKIANQFLEQLSKYKDVKRVKSEYDNKVYYIPYFAHYFFDLEKAYNNILPALNENFEGYINVVNNTARDKIIPVAEFIIETWEEFGFKTEIVYEKENFHIGTKNPRARGFKAKHKEYIIKISN